MAIRRRRQDDLEEPRYLQTGDGQLLNETGSRRRRRTDGKREGIDEIRSFFIRLAALLLVFLVLFGVVFGITPMANSDMKPGIGAGDLLLYYRLASELVSDDVVVLKKDGVTYVGRIVAKGGDTVEITEEEKLKINNRTVLESDIYYSTPQYDSDVSYPLTLEEDEYFILCDYREGATDSRYFGPVTKKEIRGKVITVLRRSGI